MAVTQQRDWLTLLIKSNFHAYGRTPLGMSKDNSIVIGQGAGVRGMGAGTHLPQHAILNLGRLAVAKSEQLLLETYLKRKNRITRVL